jgi:DNA-binding response OmpR family regulator
MVGKDVRVLMVADEADEARQMSAALNQGEFPVAWCTFAANDIARHLQEFKPSLLLVRAEVGSAQLATLLARFEAVSVAVVLVCQDVTDLPIARQMRSGVVDMLREPFDAAVASSRIRELNAELPLRPGPIRSRTSSHDVGAMVNHLMRTRRTGGLTVGQEGRAFFVRGVLKAARFRDLTMQNALAAMTRESGAWVFNEGADASGLVDLVGDDAPFIVAAEKKEPAGDRDAQNTPILFVDDEPALVAMLAGYFSKMGYPVATAVDGLDAMQQLLVRPAEVVVADLNMPRLDGWGLLRMVRDDLRTHETPVALFSAHDDYRESLRLLNAGAQAYFPKSLRLSALEAQIRELLEPRRRFLRQIKGDGGLQFQLGALGPQWVLMALSRAGFSGQLDAHDGWATWRIAFSGGRMLQCSSRVATSATQGEVALAGFLQSKQAEGSISHGSPSVEEGFQSRSTPETLHALVDRLNAEHQSAAEAQLERAQALDVHAENYALFVSVCPPAWQPMARLLCEEKLTPAQVISHMGTTPAEVAPLVRELIRRQVAVVKL